MKIEIRFNNDECTEMTIYVPDENRMYFLPVDRYDESLHRIKYSRIPEMEVEIKKFLDGELI